MINVALLTAKEFRDLQGKNNTDSTRFNPFVVNGYFAITQEEIENTTIQGFEWLNDKPIVEMDSLTIPDTTPPPSNGYGIEIPSQYHWAFPINLNGFVIELKDKNGVKYCESSQMGWTDFVNEFDKPQNNDYRLSVLPIWQYALTKVANNDYIIL